MATVREVTSCSVPVPADADQYRQTTRTDAYKIPALAGRVRTHDADSSG